MGGGGGGSAEIEETPQEKELAEIAAEQFQRQKEVFEPLEDEFIGDATSIGDGLGADSAGRGEQLKPDQGDRFITRGGPVVPGGFDDADNPIESAAALVGSMGRRRADPKRDVTDEDKVAGITSADVARQTDQQIDQAQAGAISRGAAPGSGAFNASVSEAQRGGAEVQGRGIGAARRGVQNRALRARQSAVQIGLDKEAEGIQGISEVARRAHQDAITDAQREQQQSIRNRQAATRLAGFGLGQVDFGSSGSSVAGQVGAQQGAQIGASIGSGGSSATGGAGGIGSNRRRTTVSSGVARNTGGNL